MPPAGCGSPGCRAPRGRGPIRAEISPQRLERVTLDVNLARSSKTEAAQNGDRWTPALNGVLKQERGNQSRKREPSLVDSHAQHYAGKSERGCIRLEESLDVPLFVQLAQAAVDSSRVGGEVTDPVVGLMADIPIDVLGGMAGHRSTVVTVMIVHLKCRQIGGRLVSRWSTVATSDYPQRVPSAFCNLKPFRWRVIARRR